MLTVDRKKRITADKALKHPWFSKILTASMTHKDSTIIDPHIM
jgi:hypothetical protein